MSPGMELRGLGRPYFQDFTGTWNDSIMPMDIRVPWVTGDT